LRVRRETFHISKPEFMALTPNEYCQVYYGPQSRIVLAVEMESDSSRKKSLWH
jgi:hypothetical protein